jgi:hypothetical protein
VFFAHPYNHPEFSSRQVTDTFELWQQHLHIWENYGASKRNLKHVIVYLIVNEKGFICTLEIHSTRSEASLSIAQLVFKKFCELHDNDVSWQRTCFIIKSLVSDNANDARKLNRDVRGLFDTVVKVLRTILSCFLHFKLNSENKNFKFVDSLSMSI